MHSLRLFGNVFGGIFLIAGTSIGVGMLGLPSVTAEGGFWPSVFIYICCWFFMLCTGLLILEACVWMPQESNLISLSQKFFGIKGKICCWLLYLFLFSSLMVAHIVTGGDLISQFLNIPLFLSLIIYVFLFFPVIYLGTYIVECLNLYLMLGVFVSYLLFVIPALQHLNIAYLENMVWRKALYALPLVFTAFGYQSLIPTLYYYMNRSANRVRTAIIIGTTIPLILYILWEAAILGVIPILGPHGLKQNFQEGKTVFNLLGYFLQNPALVKTGKIFAFLASSTSYIGIAISLRDFLADGLKIKKNKKGKLLLCCLVFLIPLFISLVYPTIFFTALEYAGGIGVVLLLGIFPILWVWKGRYYLQLNPLHPQLLGGKILLSILLIFALFELSLEITHLFTSVP